MQDEMIMRELELAGSYREVKNGSNSLRSELKLMEITISDFEVQTSHSSSLRASILIIV
jgi:hypothetical protein